MQCVCGMSQTTVQSKSPLTLRAIDALDRTHARAASSLHGVRNDVRGTLERALDRAQELTLAAFDRVRARMKKLDSASADAVNRAQGAVNHALDVAREAKARRSN